MDFEFKYDELSIPSHERLTIFYGKLT